MKKVTRRILAPHALEPSTVFTMTLRTWLAKNATLVHPAMACTVDYGIRPCHVVYVYNYLLITDNRDIIGRIANPVLHQNLMPDFLDSPIRD